MQIRLKDDFRPGSLRGPGAEWYNNVARLLNGAWILNGDVYRNPNGLAIFPNQRGDGLVSASSCPPYSFLSIPNDENTGIVMEPGDVILGPMTWVHWAGITGASTTPAVSSTDTCVWLEVVITKGSEAATMKVGSRSAMENSLDSTEQETTEVVPLVETTWTNDLVTKVKNLQCGDAKISRGAG